MTILLIDDSLDVRSVLRVALESEGYRVMEAADGRAGVRLYREYRTALVVVDIVMPEKDGLETVKEILAIDAAAVIFTLSDKDADGDYQEKAGKLGAKRAFRKPVNVEELLAEVEGCLDGAHLADQRSHASFFEATTKSIKECGAVRVLLDSMGNQSPVLYDSLRPADGDPPDCVGDDALGHVVAFEVTELVSQQAAAYNAAIGRASSTFEDTVYWDPSQDEVIAKIQGILERKDAKKYKGGPYSEVILVIHTDEFALTFDAVAPRLESAEFVRPREITRAFVLFAYDPRLRRCPYLELRLDRQISTAGP